MILDPTSARTKNINKITEVFQVEILPQIVCLVE